VGVDTVLSTLTETLTGPNRWVALVGTGGIGKTHLAQEAGRQMAEQGVFRGGDNTTWVDTKCPLKGNVEASLPFWHLQSDGVWLVGGAPVFFVSEAFAPLHLDEERGLGFVREKAKKPLKMPSPR
jgi:hypothetical protein